MNNCAYPNCLSCDKPDCIYDRLELEDFENDMWEEESREKKLKAVRSKRYRDSRKEEVNARSREWNEAHKEMVAETTKKWQLENKQRIAAKKRRRWAVNPILYRQKQQDYRARIKSSLPHCDECESCILVEKEKQDGYRRLCIDKMRLIEQKVSNCPQWCKKRRDKKNEQL